jgi:superfamily II DNA or RNA helicase
MSNNPSARVLWLANTKEQVAQALAAVERLPEGRQGEFFAICPAGVKSLSWPLEETTLIIVDEAHHSAADSWSAVIERTTCRRYGFTATPKRDDDRRAKVFELLGDVVYVIGHETLRDGGYIAGGRAVMMNYDVPETILGDVVRDAKGVTFEETSDRQCPDWKKYRYWHALQHVGINHNAARNDAVVRACRYHCLRGDSVLIIVGSVKHGEAIMETLGESVAMVHSKLGKKPRAERLADFASGDTACLIATSLADEGLDVPRANVLISATANRSKRLAEQRAGRVLRTMADKPGSVVYDFWDGWHFWLLAQSESRAATYRKIGLQVEIKHIGKEPTCQS